MPYIVETHHRDNTDDMRSNLRSVHLAYLDENIKQLLAAGAKLNEDGSIANGSFYILNTEDLNVAELIMSKEPYVLAGICEHILYNKWRKGYFNYERSIPKY